MLAPDLDEGDQPSAVLQCCPQRIHERRRLNEEMKVLWGEGGPTPLALARMGPSVHWRGHCWSLGVWVSTAHPEAGEEWGQCQGGTVPESWLCMYLRGDPASLNWTLCEVTKAINIPWRPLKVQSRLTPKSQLGRPGWLLQGKEWAGDRPGTSGGCSPMGHSLLLPAYSFFGQGVPGIELGATRPLSHISSPSLYFI